MSAKVIYEPQGHPPILYGDNHTCSHGCGNAVTHIAVFAKANARQGEAYYDGVCATHAGPARRAGMVYPLSVLDSRVSLGTL